MGSHICERLTFCTLHLPDFDKEKYLHCPHILFSRASNKRGFESLLVLALELAVVEHLVCIPLFAFVIPCTMFEGSLQCLDLKTFLPQSLDGMHLLDLFVQT